MFSLVEKKLCVQRNNEAAIPIQLWCFSPLFSLKLHQLAHYTAFFMLPWHLSYSESTLWNLWLKKKSCMCGGHRTHHYVLNLCNLVINVDPVCPIPYLSPFLLNHRESQRLQKLWLWMPVVREYDAKGVSYLFPGRSFMPFSSLMIHLPIIKRASLSCLVCSNKAW